jgi:hypothetical protein
MRAFECIVVLSLLSSKWLTILDMETKQESKTPWVLYTAMVMAGLVVLLLTTIVPISNWIPTQITEQGKVVAVTEKGCVVDAPTVNLPIVTQCSAQPGETVEITYYVPGKFVNGYYDKQELKAIMVQP